MENKFFIITGLSGAGKSQALKILEDFDFFCVDNLPVLLLPKFAEMCIDSGEKFKKVAVGIDVRAGKSSLKSLYEILDKIQKKGVNYKILFFTANDKTILQRFSETRRKHPLGQRPSTAIVKERLLLSRLLTLADRQIDTSNLTLGELKEIMAHSLGFTYNRSISVSVLSFGYKYGIPTDADIVIDVRFLPNPNYIPSMRFKTGLEGKVKKYVEGQKATKEFLKKFLDMLEYLLPLYVSEGKSYLTVAVGCTGGRHRSVVVAEHTGRFLRSKGYTTDIEHRDKDRMHKYSK